MSALATFRRAMRRYERRARTMGLRCVEDAIAVFRTDIATEYDAAERLRSLAEESRIYGGRRAAFLYERAADAVARLREATS